MWPPLYGSAVERTGTGTKIRKMPTFNYRGDVILSDCERRGFVRSTTFLASQTSSTFVFRQVFKYVFYELNLQCRSRFSIENICLSERDHETYTFKAVKTVMPRNRRTVFVLFSKKMPCLCCSVFRFPISEMAYLNNFIFVNEKS